MAIHKLNSLKPKTARLVQGVDEDVKGEGPGAGHSQISDDGVEMSSLSPRSPTSVASSGPLLPLPGLFSASSGDKDQIIDAILLQKGDIIRIVEGKLPMIILVFVAVVLVVAHTVL